MTLLEMPKLVSWQRVGRHQMECWECGRRDEPGIVWVVLSVLDEDLLGYWSCDAHLGGPS